jgi:hypothetical protein
VIYFFPGLSFFSLPGIRGKRTLSHFPSGETIFQAELDPSFPSGACMLLLLTGLNSCQCSLYEIPTIQHALKLNFQLSLSTKLGWSHTRDTLFSSFFL